MKVVEKFVSINGEGVRAGELAVFIRFKGCNLRCSYCDTMWANEPACPYQEESPEEIYDYIKKTGVKNVTLTGGEPLLQKDIASLIHLLLNDSELRVEIETNGAVRLKTVIDDLNRIETECQENAETSCIGTKSQENTSHNIYKVTEITSDDTIATNIKRPAFTMDYKLPSSLCEKNMIHENFSDLCQEDTVKFVCGSEEDLVRANEIIQQYDLTHICHVYFSPVFGSIEPESIVNYMIEHQLNDVRLQIQIHKVIWDPERRGV